MFCVPQLSLKERLIKKGLEKDYRAKGLNRATRRAGMKERLWPEHALKQIKSKPEIKFSVIKREERKKENIFGRIKKMFRLK